MTRPRNRCEQRRLWLVLTLCLATGCVGTRPLDLPSRSLDADEPRRAPGVAVDPAPELPPARAAAETDQAIVTLKAPASRERARGVIRDFFEAAASGNWAEVEPLIDEQAWVSGGPTTGRQRARSFWHLRLSRLDYATLGNQPIYRDSELETYAAEDAATLRPPRALPLTPQGDDVLVRVPITTPRVGRTRLFGDEIAFLLRPSGSSFVIVEMLEDFQLP